MGETILGIILCLIVLLLSIRYGWGPFLILLFYKCKLIKPRTVEARVIDREEYWTSDYLRMEHLTLLLPDNNVIEKRFRIGYWMRRDLVYDEPRHEIGGFVHVEKIGNLMIFPEKALSFLQSIFLLIFLVPLTIIVSCSIYFFWIFR